jgi:hypothetical protein
LPLASTKENIQQKREKKIQQAETDEYYSSNQFIRIILSDKASNF